MRNESEQKYEDPVSEARMNCNELRVCCLIVQKPRDKSRKSLTQRNDQPRRAALCRIFREPISIQLHLIYTPFSPMHYCSRSSARRKPQLHASKKLRRSCDSSNRARRWAFRRSLFTRSVWQGRHLLQKVFLEKEFLHKSEISARKDRRNAPAIEIREYTPTRLISQKFTHSR